MSIDVLRGQCVHIVLYPSPLQVVFINNLYLLHLYHSWCQNTGKNQCKNLPLYNTVWGRHIRHAFKAAKLIACDPMKRKSPNVPLQHEQLTWTSQLRTGQPSIFTIRFAHTLSHALKLINTAAGVVKAHLDFCASWGQTQWLLLFYRRDFYVALTLCYKLVSFFYIGTEIWLSSFLRWPNVSVDYIG